MTHDDKLAAGWTLVAPGRWRLPDAAPERPDVNDPRPDHTRALIRAAGGVPVRNANRSKGAWRPHAAPTPDGYTAAPVAPRTANLDTLRDEWTGVVTFASDATSEIGAYLLHEQRVLLARTAAITDTPQTFTFTRADGAAVTWTAEPLAGRVVTTRASERLVPTLPAARIARTLRADERDTFVTVATWHPRGMGSSASGGGVGAHVTRPEHATGWTPVGSYTTDARIVQSLLADAAERDAASNAAASLVWRLINERRAVEKAADAAARYAAMSDEDRAEANAASKRRMVRSRARRDVVDFAKGARKTRRAIAALTKARAKAAAAR